MEKTKLIVLRGPSGAGKSTAAKAVRDKYLTLDSKVAYIEQDYFRRIVLREKDIPNGFNIQLIKSTVLLLLERGYSVVMEGIFDKCRYEEMFKDLILIHPSDNFFFYFDIPLEETLKRHQTKPNKDDFGEKEIRKWYKEKDYLTLVKENRVSEKNTLAETVDFIYSVAELRAI